MRSLSIHPISLLNVILLTAAITACASNPLAIAETPAQKFAAAKLTYDAVLSGALELVQDTSVPADLRRSIQSAAAASGNVYRSANQAYVQYVAARAELTAGVTRSEKLDIATANLDRWLRELESTAGVIAALTVRN